MNTIHIQYIKTDIGSFILGCFENKLCIMDFANRKMRSKIDRRIQQGLDAQFVERDNPILQLASQQLDEYLQGKRKQFDISVLMIGTEFQKRVWHVLCNIGYGTTASYAQVAKAIDNDKAVRAVANANGANALAIIVPCHRVVESNGELGGYGGGLLTKKRLLDIEKSNN